MGSNAPSSTTAASSAVGRSISGFRNLPNPYALFCPRFLFTTLAPKDVALGPYAHPTTGKPMHIFSLDEYMVYTPFKNDHGPLSMAYTFDACVHIYDKLHAKEHKRRAICLYTSPDPQQKSNLATIAALYSLIVEHMEPWDAYQPIAHLELLPFRDAGNGVNDYALTIQDMLYGIWKAGQHDLLKLQDFDAEGYRYYEKVENGDLNVLGSFIAFASPMDPVWIEGQQRPNGEHVVFTQAQIRMMRSSFEKVMAKFDEENVGLVVRLNDELYDRAHFLQAGIEHVDMYFDDGTNPTDDIVRDFIRLVDETIHVKHKRVAVHCKAGLGRTGVLIGAYLIYKYHFTASEVIGYMRLIRPGMVVGPQQRYMQLNQMKWAGWAAADLATKAVPVVMSTPPMNTEVLPASPSTPPAINRPLTPSRRLLPSAFPKHGDAAGQPRKGRVVASATPDDSEENVIPSAGGCTPAQLSSKQGSAPTDNGSSRGVKRGSGRSPLPQTLRGESCPQPPPQISNRSLARSPSNVSCSSTVSDGIDQRATKRRPGDSSPLSKSGLSSPPPSRESSPTDSLTEEDASAPSTPPESMRMTDTMALTPTTPVTRTERARSLIPRRGAIPFKDPSPSPRKPASDGSVSDSEITPSSPASAVRSKLPKRGLLPAPRVWGTLVRLGGSTTHDS